MSRGFCKFFSVPLDCIKKCYEANASLDPENEVLIQQAIDELLKNQTVLVIAFRLQSVMNADEIIVMDDGRIIEQGTHGLQ